MEGKTPSNHSICETIVQSLNLCVHCKRRLSEFCGTLLFQPTAGGTCDICGQSRGNYEKLLDDLRGLLTPLGESWNTFMVEVIVEKPPGLKKEHGPLFDALKEDFKSEFKKRVGGALEELGKRFDPANPDLIIVYRKGRFDVRRPNLYIEGRYLKLFRNISQAKWVCNSCRGGGCAECNYKGRHFIASVEEFITVPLQAFLQAKRIVFHAGGREDVDVLVLGGGRPFIVEVENPSTKAPDLKVLERTVNSYSEGFVQVVLEKFSTPKRVEALKRSAEESLKKYEGIIRFYGKVAAEELEKASKQLSGIVIEQKTPWRVKRRRADRLRYKKIEWLSIVPIDENTARFTVLCQGGTYVKEFISGDDGRTRPSVSQILGIRCKCVVLDLVGVEMKND